MREAIWDNFGSGKITLRGQQHSARSEQEENPGERARPIISGVWRGFFPPWVARRAI